MALEGDGGRGQEQGGEKKQTMANGMGALVCFGDQVFCMVVDFLRRL